MNKDDKVVELRNQKYIAVKSKLSPKESCEACCFKHPICGEHNAEMTILGLPCCSEGYYYKRLIEIKGDK